jgi:hypothetical protein
MSLLQEVIEQYGDSEKPKAPTDKTAKTSKCPKALTDKTDKRGSVSFGSEWSELLENKNGGLTEQEIPVAEEMVAIIEMRQRGICPDHYTATTNCKWCGPVPIFEGCPPQVKGCPWCFNRLKGLPTPDVRIRNA